MARIPYPPAPELGWYSDDPQPSDAVTDAAPAPVAATADVSASSAAASPVPATEAPAAQQQPDHAQPAHAAPAAEAPHASDDDSEIEDWDGTVLSSSFTSKAPHRTYELHNEVTGQTIVIDKSTLLGRKPTMDVPEGAKAERIEDPTRTTSRNHAAISIDTDGTLWIEDYGSLNGTYIIRDGEETQVVKGTPQKLEAPATVRIGDQFFQFTERQD